MIRKMTETKEALKMIKKRVIKGPITRNLLYKTKIRKVKEKK